LIAREPAVSVPFPSEASAAWGNDRRESDQVRSPFAAMPLPTEPHLLSMVAHELRGPLTALVSSSELLVEDFDILRPEQMRDMAAAMHRGALWLHGLVENLLCAATMRDGRFQIHRQAVSILDVMAEVESVFSPLLKQRGQSLVTTSRSRIPEVSADPRRIGQVLFNLISNASKYSSNDTTIEVSIGVRRGMARVEVVDEGPGIPEGLTSQLFEAFFRANTATQSGKEGVGLGLSIVKSIVESHDGRVGAENLPQGGACFWFELSTSPRAEPPALRRQSETFLPS
jgi:K+-sensing histidine kinase KdpD